MPHRWLLIIALAGPLLSPDADGNKDSFGVREEQKAARVPLPGNRAAPLGFGPSF